MALFAVPQPSLRWDNWVSVVANVATVTALALAVWQLFKAARAAERTEHNVLQGRLLNLVNELRNIERALDGTVVADEREGAIRATREWRQAAVQLHGLLSAQKGPSDALRNKLRASIAMASRTKTELLDHHNNVDATTKKLRDTIADLCDEIGLAGAEIAAAQGE